MNLYLGSPSKVPVFAHGMGFSLGLGVVSATRILVGFAVNKRFIGCVVLFVFVCVFDVENRPRVWLAALPRCRHVIQKSGRDVPSPG